MASPLLRELLEIGAHEKGCECLVALELRQLLVAVDDGLAEKAHGLLGVGFGGLLALFRRERRVLLGAK